MTMSSKLSPYNQPFLTIDDVNSSLRISDILINNDVTNSTTGRITQSDPQQWRMNTFTIVCLSILFIIIVVVGIVGNSLVILVIFCDMKMRRSVTNMLITNLAISDLIIMVLGVPEIVMVMMDNGWTLGFPACRSNRFLLVTALYSSVLSLLILCCERFIAIVFPFMVSKLCTRRKTLIIIAASWVTAICCALPVAVYNRLSPSGSPVQYCQISLPGRNPKTSFLVYKYIEAVFFYFIPMIAQIILYSFIAKRLFTSNEQLRTRFQTRSSRQEITNSNDIISTSSTSSPISRTNSRSENTIKARRGVVKMLVSCVILYFISYSPLHFQLIFSTFSTSDVFTSHEFFIFVIVITHVNSAANPILYGIFSQNFRRRFKSCFKSGFACCRHPGDRVNNRVNSTGLSRLTSMKSTGHGKTFMSRL